MPKKSEIDLERFRAGLEQIVSTISIEDRSFTPKQTAEILGNGKTKTFELIESGALESYLDGRARRVTGRSIVAYRNRKLQKAKEQTA
jgi:hypothetical protein